MVNSKFSNFSIILAKTTFALTNQPIMSTPAPTVTPLRQDYAAYTPTDYRIWRTLTQRQLAALKSTACAEYLECLQELYPILSADHPPRF